MYEVYKRIYYKIFQYIKTNKHIKFIIFIITIVITIISLKSAPSIVSKIFWVHSILKSIHLIRYFTKLPMVVNSIVLINFIAV